MQKQYEIFLFSIMDAGQHSGALVNTVSSQQESSEFEPAIWLGSFSVEFCRFWMGFLQIRWFPFTAQRHAN